MCALCKETINEHEHSTHNDMMRARLPQNVRIGKQQAGRQRGGQQCETFAKNVCVYCTLVDYARHIQIYVNVYKPLRYIYMHK